MKIRGINIAYEDTGNGAVIVWIHGQPFNRSMWRDQLPAFAADHRQVVPDLRGYGESDVPLQTTLLDELALDLLHLLERLQVRQAIFVGLSMGGQVALELYRLAPQLFRALVLADTTATAEDEAGYVQRLQLADYIETQGMAVFTRERIRKFLAAATFEHQPAVVQHLEEMMLSTNAAGSARVQRGRAERSDLGPLLPAIHVPVLFIAGEQDEFTTVPMMQAMQQQVTGSRLAVIADAGHIPNMEQPETFNRELRHFIDSLDQ